MGKVKQVSFQVFPEGFYIGTMTERIPKVFVICELCGQMDGDVKELKFRAAASCVSGGGVGGKLIHLSKLVCLGLQFCV